MKNIIKNLKKGTLIVTMFTTLLSFANEPLFYTIKNDAKTTSLTLSNVKKGNLLSIKDVYGITLYSELIKENGVYTKGFDLTLLPNGDYVFELDKDVEISTIPFSVIANKVEINQALEKTIYKPITNLKNDIVYISKLTLDKSPLKVQVYFAESNDYSLIYSEKIEDTQNIEKVFKLTGLDKGSYKIVFNSEGREYTKFLN
ncbi:hypothetical protein APS56_10365 [Pseudalgibacter alginicilyticus]|uniref:Uncharacterized protein n=1 Tax=Pseudalgibacter alginicilyticus TaxID=1736674 RepID=A0A0P0CM13_9FLAO|nr:hypothetical protein [Pseudalgibacter alginicilyticus]ALJ05497.1 hypothetical protein APS56_10365 [Pseudalgibacter alginicilyticus]